MVANTKIGILVVVKIPNEDFTDSGDWYGDARGKRPDFLLEFFCNLPLMRRTYDVELLI